MINNNIYLKRKNKVFVKGSDNIEGNSIQIVATLLKNIEKLRYTLEPKLIEKLLYVNLEEIIFFYDNLISSLKQMLGSHVIYKPMYPNFPKQVMEASEVELYINAILHYFGDWVGLRILPKYIKEDRNPLKISKDLKVISLGNKEDFDQIFKNLLSSKSSLSQSDYSDLKWYFKNNQVEDILPEKIFHKEILAFISNELLKIGRGDCLSVLFNTATDVLRLATALSDGDISLASNTRFKKFSRKYRRLILSLLENCKNITEDMLKYKGKWIRLGEILHPFEQKYLDKYTKSADAFLIIRDNLPFKTFNNQVEKYLSNKDTFHAVQLLKQRPGEMARRLDHLLRISNDPFKIINIFNSVIDHISTPVLLQMIAHFYHRNEEKELRIFFPKGNIAKSYSIENKLPDITPMRLLNVVNICRNALRKRFSKLPPLGNTYIDERLRDYVVPLGQRSASKSLLTLSRFSKIEFLEGNTLRFFLWWKDEQFDRVDIDLSAVMYDDDWDYLEHVSYTNLRSAKYQVVHSGDITSAPHGACEFLDINIDSVKKFGGRYIVVSLLSYSGQPFVEISECFAGWMIRKEPQSGEIFEPKTVENKVDLTANTKICIPVIIDLKDRKVIWIDLALTKNPNWYNNIEGNQQGMVLMGKGITSLHKPDLYELFSLHAKARGTLVEECEEVETTFSLTEGITPYDIDVINSEFL